MTPDADATPGHWLAEGFAEHAVGWARELGAPSASLDFLREAAYQVSRATTLGHLCIDLSDLEGARADTTDARRQLLASQVVGTASAPANLPLVLDDDGRLYLNRYFDYEQRLATCLMARVAAPLAQTPPRLHATLDRLFGVTARGGRDTPDWQRIAVALAMMRNLTVISGGPGTGKTTTVANLIACLIEAQPGCRIALAAPTGKAAARMLDALRANVGRLHVELASRFPTESFTVHRLLGVIPGSDRFRHDAGNPLPYDVLVVDEASMLDLALATRLLEAMPVTSKVVLLGDKDQLAAVEAGSVFAEICSDPTLDAQARIRLAEATGVAADRIVAAPPIERTLLRDSVIWFTENYRFAAGSAIGRLAGAINTGDLEAAIETLRTTKDQSVDWIEDDQRVPRTPTLARIHGGFAPYLAAVRAATVSGATSIDTALHLADLFASLDAFRILCAEREGPRGVAGINDAVGRWFRQSLDHPFDRGPRSPWYPGRPVMIARNDYALRLFNGDVGIVLPDERDELGVVFADGADGAAGFRRVPITRLPEHDTAFATTVHKAQGSEFDGVMIMLPSRESRVVTRELLYTGVTRARSSVVLAAGADVLRAGIATQMRRASGLIARCESIATPAPTSPR